MKAADSQPFSESRLAATQSWIVLATKLRIARNAIRNVRKHVYLHAAVGLGLAFFLFGGGTGVFYYIFRFLMRLEVFGPPLMDSLAGIVFLIFFAMLLFSNLIITLSTTYLSREVEFLMAMPLSRYAIFRQKLIETLLYSSWAFAMLSFPIFVSFGLARQAPWFYYPLVVLIIGPFLMIPATLGAIITMIMTSILPARKTRTLCIVLGIVSIGISLLLARVTGVTRLLETADDQDILRIMNTLSVGSSPLLPSAWLSNALSAIAPPDPRDIDIGGFAYWTAMLVATSLFLYEVCRLLVPLLYYKGWCLSRDAAVRQVESHAKFSPFRWIDAKLEAIFPSPTAALLSKDLKTFWRDPAQWTQLVILFGLMLMYTLNIQASQRYSRTIALVVNDWRTLLAFFNLGAACFVLSILTTRFVFPMLSLEGRGFWTVGLAPIPRSRVVWQKFVLCYAFCMLVALPLTLLSSIILQLDSFFIGLSVLVVIVMSGGLTSLSVGFGALLPDFKEDNPARIANGIGGTLNVLVSLVYIVSSITLIVIPSMIFQARGGLPFWGWLIIAAAVALQAAALYFPMRWGLRKWDAIEF